MPAWIAPFKPFFSALLLPPGIFVAALCLGLFLLRRHRSLARGLLAFSLAGLWLGQSVAVARWLEQHLLTVPPALSAQDIARLKRAEVPTAIIILGGGLHPGALEYGGQAVLSEHSFVRVRYGAWLARATGLPLGYTGGVGWAARAGAPPEAHAAKAAVEAWGLPLRWAESASRDTRENAEFTLPMLLQSDIQEVVLVTEATHMPRSLRAFTQAANGQLRITPAPTGFISAADNPWLEWLPSARGQRLVNFILHEWLGLLAGA